MNKKIFFVSSLFLFGQPIFAMFCPNNFNQINIGDTIDQVIQQCGKPDEQKKLPPADTGPQSWSYYVSTSVTGQTLGNPQASFKMDIAFNNNKVINITVNGTSLAATTICGPNIQVGDTPDTIKSACGKPVFINKNQPQDQSSQPTSIQFKYNGPPVVYLIFENNKLTQRN